MSQPAPRPRPDLEPSYDGDIYAWALRQADHLRTGNFGALDLENLAEEIESVGRSEFQSLVSALTIVLQHMLKWEHQSGRRTRSWALSIDEHRARAARCLRDNPSLKSRWDDAVADAYHGATRRAARETGLALSTFPGTCPYGRDDIMAREYPID